MDASAGDIDAARHWENNREKSVRQIDLLMNEKGKNWGAPQKTTEAENSSVSRNNAHGSIRSPTDVHCTVNLNNYANGNTKKIYKIKNKNM